MSSTALKPLEEKAHHGVERFEDKSLSSNEVVSQTPSDLGLLPTAATLYGENPVAAAAAVGWAVGVATDVATSKKHPAEFTVLTKTVARTVSGGGGSGFRDYPSIQAIGAGSGDSIVIGFDTEFVHAEEHDPERGWIGENEDVARRIISYQFAVIDPTDDTQLRLCVVLPREYNGPLGRRVARLSFERALEICIEELVLHEHPLAQGWNEKGVPYADCLDNQGKHRPSKWYRKGASSRALPITLVAHFQHADLTTFVDKRKAVNTWNEAYPTRQRNVSTSAGYDSRRARWLDDSAPDILRAVLSASAGMVSPKPVRLVLDGANWYWRRPVEVSIRDTMAQSGAVSLKTLGESVGVPKLDVPGDWITRMDDYLAENPGGYLDYAANDAVIALEYVSALMGITRRFRCHSLRQQLGLCVGISPSSSVEAQRCSTPYSQAS